MRQPIILKPIKEFPRDYERVEACILDIFRRDIYLPLVELLGAPQKLLANTLDQLVEAIQSGRISHSRGAFTGKFSAGVSATLRYLGATWDRERSAWRIPLADLPLEARMAISTSDARFAQTLRKIDDRLAEVKSANIADYVAIQEQFDRTIWRVDAEVEKTLKGLAIKPKLTAAQAEAVATGYTLNLERYIKNWTDAEVLKLRKTVQQKAFQGHRYEGLIKTIQQSYGVSQNKAKFLARQETNLLMCKVKETRYQDAGVDEYYWQDVGGTKAHPVRKMHKELAERSRRGEIFRFSDPPVTNPQGGRNNPGEDFNCRCTARPLVRF